MTSHPPANLQTAVLNQARELGFDLVGIDEAALPPRAAKFQDWLDQGYAGTMTYLNRGAARRKNPDLVLPGVQSIICAGMSYAPAKLENSAICDPTKGVISFYAAGKDYHAVLEERLNILEKLIIQLNPADQCKSYVDTGPILERDFAELAGLGFIGKNTLLISRHKGSLLFLGEILTTAKIPPTPSGSQPSCGSCTRCIAACPTQAIIKPYVLDARRCISYLTIEYKGTIPEDLRHKLGNKVFGCDDCQTCCPWNIRFAIPTTIPDWQANSQNQTFPLNELAELSEAEFATRFAGTPVLRAGFEAFMRNVAIALGNCPEHSSKQALESLSQHPSLLVSNHARWALDHMGMK